MLLKPQNKLPAELSSPLGLLGFALQKLDLTTTQRNDLQIAYGAIAKALESSQTLMKHVRVLWIKTQGSVRADTVIREPGTSKHDLDILCILELTNSNLSPSEVWQLVWDALGEHGVYSKMRHPKSRCITLEYKREGFSLDVVPTIPSQNSLLIPDKKKDSWSGTHPIRFCDEWFLPIANKLPTFPLLNKEGNSEATFSAKAMEVDVEEFPEGAGFDKLPLQRIIQFAKYDRCEFYMDRSQSKPSSILLTTIAAQSYDKEVTKGHPDLESFICAVIGGMESKVKVVGESQDKFEVLNPVYQDENFAEHWDEETYRAFAQWHEKFYQAFRDLIFTEKQGLDSYVTKIEAQLPITKELHLAETLGTQTRKRQDSGTLLLGTGAASSAGLVGVPQNSFYGSK